MINHGDVTGETKIFNYDYVTGENINILLENLKKLTLTTMKIQRLALNTY